MPFLVQCRGSTLSVFLSKIESVWGRPLFASQLRKCPLRANVLITTQTAYMVSVILKIALASRPMKFTDK